MDDIKISLDSSGRTGEITVVRVDGVIDTMTSSELERIMNTLMEQKKYKIVIDLAGVDYISSAGWGIFISNIREIKANAGDIKLARMMPSVYEIFELLEFDSILKAYDNIEKAKGDFRSAGDGSAPQETAAAPSPQQKTATSSSGAASAQILQATATEVTTEEYVPQPEAKTQNPAFTEPSATRSAEAQPRSIEQEVLGLIKADPFYSISELVKIVSSGGNGSVDKVGWWDIWKILRRNSLLSKKNRFRYSRKK